MNFLSRAKDQPSLFRSACRGFAFLAIVSLTTSFVHAQSGTEFTPDPYFSAPNKNQVRSLLQGSAWDPPATSAAASTQAPPKQTQPATIAWEPPLTNVNPVAANPAAIKPTAAMPVVTTPATSKSIIRESNSFGMAQTAVGQPGLKRVANPYAGGNEFVAAMPASKPSSSAQLASNPKNKPAAKSFKIIDDSNDFGSFGASAARGKDKVANSAKPLMTSPKPSLPAKPAALPKLAAPAKPSAPQTRSQVSSTTKPTRAPAGQAAPANSVPFAPTQLLAKVGSEPIFAGDMLFEINQMLEKFMPGAPESAKAVERQKLVQRMLPKFVDQKILYVGMLDLLPEEADVNDIVGQAAKEFDEKALPEMLKKAGAETTADFDADLREMGSSLRKLRDTWARDQLTRYFLSQQLDAKPEITHQQLLTEYRSNFDDYAIQARVRWEQVMVRFDNFSSKQEAKAKMIELGDQLVYGANFEALAKKSSQGYRASEGGQHDWTSKDALVLKEIDRAIFDLPIGELSDIIETRDGFHIVRVKERQDEGHKPFSEAQVDIKQRITEKKRNESFEKHMAELRKRIPVEYFSQPSAASRANLAKKPGTLLGK